MNILFISNIPPHPHRGGIERVTDILAREFIARGHAVTVTFTEPETQDETSEITPYERIHIDCRDKSACMVFDDILRKKRTDIIICQCLITDTEMLIRNRKHEARVVSVFHNQPFASIGKERLAKRLVKPVSMKSKLVKAVGILFPYIYRKSRQIQNRSLFETLSDVSDRVYMLSRHYIPRVARYAPKADISRFDAINNPNTFNVTDTSIHQKEKIVLWLGRIDEPQKNTKGFIDVWKIFHKSHPDWKALVVGNGPYMDFYKKYVTEHGIDNLSFEGNRKNVGDYYSKSRIICMTSLYEGWPMVLNEAMAYGCIPVAYNSFEAVTEILEHEVSGMLATPFDTYEMATLMSRLASNDTLCNKIAERAVKSVKKYDVSAICDIWEKKLQELIM